MKKRNGLKRFKKFHRKAHKLFMAEERKIAKHHRAHKREHERSM